MLIQILKLANKTFVHILKSYIELKHYMKPIPK